MQTISKHMLKQQQVYLHALRNRKQYFKLPLDYDNLSRLQILFQLSYNLSCRCSTIIDFDLIRSYKYWSVIIGIAFEFYSDLAFIALIPALLDDTGFESTAIPGMMTMYFLFDLAGRLSYSLINLCYRTRNRYVFMFGALITAILRGSKYYC